VTRAAITAVAACGALALLAVAAIQCAAPGGGAGGRESPPTPTALRAWSTIYGVLQHPRCMNCHPAGDAPLQGDQSAVHAQNVKRGSDGKGLFALRCDACHQTQNLPGAHLPPGAPNWHLPRSDMSLVFEGRSSTDLCRQLRDPARNGGMTPEQLLAHVEKDPLVLWGWSPGEGRAPVPTSHAEFVQAMRTWVGASCGCP
jgi:hypothetical protein